VRKARVAHLGQSITTRSGTSSSRRRRSDPAPARKNAPIHLKIAGAGKDLEENDACGENPDMGSERSAVGKQRRVPWIPVTRAMEAAIRATESRQ
jgi:hypothetical protein